MCANSSEIQLGKSNIFSYVNKRKSHPRSKITPAILKVIALLINPLQHSHSCSRPQPRINMTCTYLPPPTSIPTIIMYSQTNNFH